MACVYLCEQNLNGQYANTFIFTCILLHMHTPQFWNRKEIEIIKNKIIFMIAF